MSPLSVAVADHDQARERVASLFTSRWLQYYVASKLRSDPVFQLAYELVRDTCTPILDVGCGVGLLAFYLRERGLEQPITGIDIDARKICRAQAALERRRYGHVNFASGDVAHELSSFCGSVVVFDLLHYLEPIQQQALLKRIAAELAPGALLLLRDCPRDGSARFRATYAAEVFAQMISWNWSAPLHFPTAESINAAFPTSDFSREMRPAWGRTPFNNRLFIFRRARSRVAPEVG
ncbi:MAG: class I SAM-dependent methyltransferase [Chthoniobacterales bacterium]|nr:class I SAM-dependent methyltransferase [Chthoniobacterales bacterium]